MALGRISTNQMSSHFSRLFIQCSGLQPNLFELCNPMVALFIQKPDGLYEELNRTEVIRSDTNPIFTHSIIIDREEIEGLTRIRNSYGLIEYRSMLRFVVFNTGKSEILDYQNVLGACDCGIFDLTEKNSFQLKIGPRTYGQMIVSVEPVEMVSRDIIMSYAFACKDIPQLDVASLSDPFFQITRRITGSDNFHPVYISEARMNTSQPIWKPMEVDLGHLCNGNMECTLFIQLYDWDSPEVRSEIGYVKVKPKDLITGSTFPIVLHPGIKTTLEPIFYTLERKMESKDKTNLDLQEIEAKLIKNSVSEDELPKVVPDQCVLL
jgi:hypothetical protein